jgi:hypothetical protein
MKSSKLICTVLLAVSALCASAAFAQGSMTLSTTVDEGMLTPTLSWQSEALSCEASGDTEWQGTKAGSGSVTLSAAPTTQARAFALVCATPEDTQAFLTWTPPTRNTDGTTLTNLAGYRLLYGNAANALNRTAQIDNAGASSYTLSNLAPGDWFFALRAFTTQGAESVLSNVTSKTTRAGVEWSQQTGVKVPEAPVLSSVE